MTGASYIHDEYAAHDPAGRARPKAVHHDPPHEVPDDEYPLMLTTGRLVYHFHTRTKPARSSRPDSAAPDAYVQLSVEDARTCGVTARNWVEVKSRRGAVVERAMVCGIDSSTVFVPFHHGYWDAPERPRAANELPLFEWDPVSKQPHFKYSAVNLRVLSESEVAKLRAPRAVGLRLGAHGG